MIEYLGYALTLARPGPVFVLWRKGPVRYQPVTEGPVVWQDGVLRWHDEPAMDLPPEREVDRDITADHERFEVLAGPGLRSAAGRAGLPASSGPPPQSS